MEGIYGTETRRLFNNVQAKLFNTDLELDNLAGLRLGHHEVQLLLGAGLLEKFIFQIDYPNSRLRLFERGSVDIAKLENICSGQVKLATVLESFQYKRSDSFGVNPPLY